MSSRSCSSGSSTANVREMFQPIIVLRPGARRTRATLLPGRPTRCTRRAHRHSRRRRAIRPSDRCGRTSSGTTGSCSSAAAMFVSGPIVTRSWLARFGARRCPATPRPHPRLCGAARFRQRRAAHSILTVDPLCGVERPVEGAIAPCKHRDVGTTTDVERHDRVAHSEVERDIAGDDGDRPDVDARIAHGEQRARSRRRTQCRCR